MQNSLRFRCLHYRSCVLSLPLFFIIAFAALHNSTRAEGLGPILLTEATSNKAIALSSDALVREPFRLISPESLGTDKRTRIMLFAMQLGLLAGEGSSALTADAEDAAHRRLPLAVEYVGAVPGNEWMSYVVLRLNSELGDAGDILVRINLHGLSSNRVRIAVGHQGGGPLDDVGAQPHPAPGPPSPPIPPTPTPNPYTGAASTSDAYRFLEQSTFGPTPALLSHVQSIGFRAFLNEQFAAPVSGYPSLPPAPTDRLASCQGDCERDNYTMLRQVIFQMKIMLGKFYNSSR